MVPAGTANGTPIPLWSPDRLNRSCGPGWSGCTLWSRLEPGGRLGAGERRPGRRAEQQGGPAEGQFEGGSTDTPTLESAFAATAEDLATVTAGDLRAAYRELAGEQAIGFTIPAL
jgi:hypothetical protein